jgi:CAAX prenyl protease-like protein
MPERTKILSYVLPFFAFAAFLALVQFTHGLSDAFWAKHAEFWIYPLQTVVCGGIVVFFWRDYFLGAPRRASIAVGVGLLIFIIWITPQIFLRQPPRLDGFNPTLVASNPAAYWFTVVFRFLRLVVVVPLVEEIFWRGFLLRYLINQEFERMPVGAFSWFSFAIVAVIFMLSHATPDWPAAIISGALFNCVAYWTRSLSACVLCHAVANLSLGLWIMNTQQWGFW